MSQPPMLTAINGLGESSKKSFLTLSLITQSCHGVANTVFVPPPTKPVWFDDLNAKLDKAKAVSHTWIDDIAPSITGGVPKWCSTTTRPTWRRRKKSKRSPKPIRTPGAKTIPTWCRSANSSKCCATRWSKPWPKRRKPKNGSKTGDRNAGRA